MKFTNNQSFRSDDGSKKFILRKLTGISAEIETIDLTMFGEERSTIKRTSRKDIIQKLSDGNPQLGVYLIKNYSEETKNVRKTKKKE